MTVQQTCNYLWGTLREAAILEAERNFGGQFTALDRIKEDGWLDSLLADEIANERRHRRMAPDGVAAPAISAKLGAMVTLLSNIAEGALLIRDPGCSIFFTVRQSAAYGKSIGWLLRNQLSNAWIESASKLDYATLMQG